MQNQKTKRIEKNVVAGYGEIMNFLLDRGFRIVYYGSDSDVFVSSGDNIVIVVYHDGGKNGDVEKIEMEYKEKDELVMEIEKKIDRAWKKWLKIEITNVANTFSEEEIVEEEVKIEKDRVLIPAFVRPKNKELDEEFWKMLEGLGLRFCLIVNEYITCEIK